MPKRALGRGLNAILPEPKAAGAIATGEGEKAAPAQAGSGPERPSPAPGLRVESIPLDRIDPNPHQPRRRFDTAKLTELANSIDQEGVLQPILVKRNGERFEIVAGERRFRACRAAGKAAVPAIVTDVGERGSLKLALVENLQREDLNPIEEARAFQVLLDEFGWTQEELGDYLGRDRSTVSNTLRLLNLPGAVQDMVARGGLSAGHVRALVNLESGAALEMARLIERRQLSVRQAERLARVRKRGKGALDPPAGEDPLLRKLREGIEAAFGLPVKVHYRGGRGRVEIGFGSDRELERILEVLRVSADGPQ